MLRIALRRALAVVQRSPPSRIPTIRHFFPSQYLQIRNFSSNETSQSSVPLGKLETKMQMIYTCKVCSTRNSQLISKVAYNQGVVLVRCSGCSNLHLVADNLGWFRDNKTNIEDILKEKGETVRKVSLGDEFIEFVDKNIEK